MKVQTFSLKADNPAVTLTTYLLDDSSETINGGSRPAIIICPGGGYFNCSDREAEPIALKFNALGYHAFVLRYSTYNDGSADLPDLVDLPPKKERLFPQQLLELGQAMILVKKHAEKWHVDPQKVAVCGFSAGGHNAALYATNWHRAWFTKHFGVDKDLLQPAACILGYALTDYVMLNQQIKEVMQGMDQQFMKASMVALLGQEEPSLDQLQQTSPVLQVDQNTPATFIWATADDPLVSSLHSLKFATALKEQNIPFELHLFEHGAHGLSLATQATAASQSQIVPDVAMWFDLCATWLQKRFALPLPKLSAFEQMLADNQKA